MANRLTVHDEPAFTQNGHAKPPEDYLPVGMFVPMLGVTPQPLQWLWKNRIPLGKFSLFIGDPGMGKSLLSADLAARVTTGARFPCAADHAPRGKVLLVACEDDAADTIRPRLEAADADLSMVTLLSDVRLWDVGRREFTTRLVNLQTDLHVIAGELETGDYKLVIFDSITGFMGKADNNSNLDVRNVLTPLAVLASKYNVAMLGISHLTKDTGKAARHRANGSIAYTAVARSVLAVAADHDDESLKVFAGVKANLGPPPATLGFRVSLKPSGVPYVDWLTTPIATTAEQALGPAPQQNTKRGTAAMWLTKMLANGPQASRDVIEAAEQYGYSESTIRRALKEIDGTTMKHGFGDGWLWSLEK